MPRAAEAASDAGRPVRVKPARMLRVARVWFRRTQLPSLERNAASALLLTVAMLHAVFVLRDDLTQWKGGGFGMFSTVDAGGSRTFRVDLHADGVRYRAVLPADSSLRHLVSVTRRLPSDHNIDQFLGFLSGTVWVLPGDPGGTRHEVVATTDAGAEAASETGDRVRPSQLVSTGRGLDRLVPWNPDRVAHGKVVEIDRIVVSFFKLRYDRVTRESRLERMGSKEAAGMTVEEMAEELELPVDYLRANWM